MDPKTLLLHSREIPLLNHIQPDELAAAAPVRDIKEAEHDCECNMTAMPCDICLYPHE